MMVQPNTSTLQEPPPTLRRIVRPWPERKMAVFDRWRHVSMDRVLAGAADAHVRTLYLVGGARAANTPARPYFFDACEHGWELNGYSTDPRSARYRRVSDGAKVDVHMSAAWFAHEDDPQAVRLAMLALRARLRMAFDPGVSIMGTPSRTGLDLLQRSLPHNGQYPVLPPDIRSVLAANLNSQGRTHPWDGGPGVAEHLYWLDGRFMYAHCLRGLPTGRPHYRATRVVEDPDAPAFYCVAFREPVTWRYPFGLLPELYDGPDGRTHTRWPHDGQAHVGWCTGAELAVARAAGYWLSVQEAITFDGGQPDPMRNWIERLRSLRHSAEQRGQLAVAEAARRLVIEPVGAFARTSRLEERSMPRSKANRIPEEASDVRLAGDRIDYKLPMPLHPDLQVFAHPEWAAMVWGRARAHLAKAAMRYTDECPQGHILWWRNDALVVDVNPHWVADGPIGSFRVKREVSGPLAIPCDETAYRALLRAALDDESADE